MLKNIPRHLAIIMDGNGRWAKSRLLPRTYGHSQGVKTLERVLDTAFSVGVKIFSAYAFSTENWSRPKDEVDKLFSILRDYLDGYGDKITGRKIKLNIMGDISALPADLQTAISKALKKTAKNEDGIFNIGLNYGARAEILKAVNDLLKSGAKTASAAEFERALYTLGFPDPDLIIRTAGEKRLSNFMLYQAAYSELYFTDVYWPDFDEAELNKALAEYDKRIRRYGNVD